MDPRKLLKRNQPKESQEVINVSTLDFSSNSHNETNRSLLVHEQDHDLFSDNASSERDIFDADIPLEKRTIINDSNYFKQLSLSFYGADQTPQKSIGNRDSHLNVRTENSKLDTVSLSPRYEKDYYYGFKRSPLVQVDRNYSQLCNNNNNSQVSKYSALNVTTPMPGVDLNISQVKAELSRNLRGGKIVTNPDPKNIKAYRINTQNLNTSVARNTSTPTMSLQAGSGRTLNSNEGSTPKYANLIYKEINIPKKTVKTNYQKIASSKLKGSSKDYLITEPMSAGYCGSAVQIVPKKLQMYVQNNVSALSLKGIVRSEGKLQTNRMNYPLPPEKEKLNSNIRPLIRNIQEIAGGRNLVSIGQRSVKKTGYYM